VLILRDVLGWPARDTATALAISVASANSALQRARATLREHLPEGRLQWPGAQTPTAHERAVVRRYMEAMERADVAAVAALLHEDTRATMPPYPMWFAGRDAIVTAMIPGFDPDGPQYMGDWLMVPVAANRLPGAAAYLRAPGDDTWRAFGIDVLRVEGDQIVEITAFHDTAFPAFGLPPTR
jgi:RNA polymerase sigma-70 factor (ECF subfamily)